MKRYVNFLALMVFLPMSYASDDDDDASSATLVEQEVIYACVKYDKKEGSLKKDSPLRYTEPFEDCKKNEVKVSWNTIGPEGPEGPVGADGIDGAEGAPGAKGAPGVPGQDGVNGANGFSGLDGQDGAEGAPGAKGDKGDLGIPGQDGANGIDGVKGAPGVPGQDGVNGANGFNGLDGQDGADGIDGVGFDGLDGSSCSVAQVGSSAVITCEDGTSAALASAGTVVVYPEGMLGESPPLTYPTGAVVIKDASGTVLGEALADFAGGHYIELKVGETTSTGVLANVTSSSSVELFRPTVAYFLEEDCQGLPFVQHHHYIIWDDSTDEYYVGNPDVVSTTILFGSQKTSSYVANGILQSFACENGSVVVSALPTVPFVPPQEILNAVYPISLEQLP